MTTNTFTPLAFAAHLTAVELALRHEIHAGLDRAGAIVEEEAKRVLGTYEYGWPALSPQTIRNKGGRDTPGIDTGEMHDSIGHRADETSVQIGSDDQKLVWFEHGTVNQPPRSVLAEALARKGPEAAQVIADHVHRAFPLSLVTVGVP